jgi:hypothetical protein
MSKVPVVLEGKRALPEASKPNQTKEQEQQKM